MRVRRRISGNTNKMPRKNKGDGPIMVLSDGRWVKSVCYVFFPVATHGLFC